MSYTNLERWVLRLGSRSDKVFAPTIFVVVGSLFLWAGVYYDSTLQLLAGACFISAVHSYERSVWYGIVRKIDPHLTFRTERKELTGMDI